MVAVELCVQSAFEQLVERLEVHELGSVILAEAVQCVQHSLLDVVGQCLVSPQVVEPSLELGQQVRIGDGEVNF